jgi:hypothetical protein
MMSRVFMLRKLRPKGKNKNNDEGPRNVHGKLRNKI